MPPATALAPQERRTQAERRATTRAALLDAALATLVEQGAAGFTTTSVCRRAGLSQGALFKHFPTKDDLLAAVSEHLFDELRDDYDQRFHDLPDPERTVARAIDLLWVAMGDPRLHAAYDLYTAARTDDTLRTSLAPVVTAHVERLHALGNELLADLGVAPSPRTAATIDLAILSMQGLMLNAMVSPFATSAARDRLARILPELGSQLLLDPIPTVGDH